MLHVDPRHLQAVQKILAEIIPDRTLWVFGSRAHGVNLKPYSDLDLAVMGDQPLELSTSVRLKDAFSESNLPFKVDIVQWCELDETFKDIIRKNYVELKSK